MKKTVSLDSAMLKAARRQKAFGDGRSFRDSKFAKFMQDGNMVTGKMACVGRTGDGVKYGWKSDASMLGDAKHYGVHMIHVADGNMQVILGFPNATGTNSSGRFSFTY